MVDADSFVLFVVRAVRGLLKDKCVLQESRKRMLLWVDAVGGFLVCLSPQATLGQALPTCDVDIPLSADVSRRHAMIRRHTDEYVIEPWHPVFLRGREVEQPEPLRDGDQISLGKSMQIEFRQPHALSATARLMFSSRHSTQPAADGVILMGDSLVLGPQDHNHIVCREWTRDVILFRRGDQLWCRSPGGIEVDGASFQDEAPIGPNSRIAGSDFSVALETL